MKRIFALFLIFAALFAFASCGSKKENPAYEEQVSKEIKAEEGGKVESSDGKTSIEIPADALDSDTKITMTIYDISGYAAIADKIEGKKVVSKVVEFEPSGIIFKKPVIITMTAAEAFENKIVSAAVFYEQEGRLSYSEHGAYGVLGRDAAGDPIMTTAAGDPIMLSDGNLTTGAGDPIMNAAAGDPIMMSAAGDPIMTNAAGDPIMNAAAGDPIMMTTGHFTAYTFIAIDSEGPVEGPDEEPETDEEAADKDEEPVVEDDDDEIADEDDDIDISDIEISDEDEDEIPEEIEDETPVVDEDEIPDVDEDIIVPESELVLSKVLCTGQTRCTDGNYSLIDCPKEGEEFYGQDAQFVAKNYCLPHKYSRQYEPVAVEEDDPEEGEGTGLRNILHGKSNTKNIRGGAFRDGETGETYEFVLDENTGLKWILFDYSEAHGDHAQGEEKCASLTYGGHEWRLPTAKEILSVADHDRFASATNEFYFSKFGIEKFWTSTPSVSETGNYWIFKPDYGLLDVYDKNFSFYSFACVSGEEYGKPGEYEVKTIGGREVVFDPSTNLLWQKGSVPANSWKDALAYCQNLEYAGYSDWRLPNKNELVTLVDYSKADPASSFPGMVSETLLTSTFKAAYGGADDPLVIDMKDGMIKEYYSYKDVSLICVRSDSKPLPAGRTIPICDESRIGPCEDANTHYIWSSPDLVNSRYNRISWERRAFSCRESDEGGISQWRIPTIDEIRTLLVSSESLKTNGECHVTDGCSDYFNEECFNEAVCSPEDGTSGEGAEWIMSSLFDYAGYLSGTLSDEENAKTWFVDLKSSSLFSFTEETNDDETRCIKDESIPVRRSSPYTDPASHLTWSSRSKSSLYWYDAAKYCKDLVEGGSNNWRVPTIDELKTLIRNCPEGDCDYDSIGTYSAFVEPSVLWSSSLDYDDVYGDIIKVLDFSTASDIYQVASYDEYAKVRCVRSGDDPETVSDYMEELFPFEIGDVIWSKVSEKQFRSGGYGGNNVPDEYAEKYCSDLNEEGYGGRTDWTLPSIYEVASLLKKSVCSNKNDFFGDTVYNGTRCNEYSFDGYSIFDDMITLCTDSSYSAFNFASGTMLEASSCFVRCVVVLPDSGS